MKNLLKTLKLFVFLSVLFVSIFTARSLYSQENIYHSKIVFVGAEHILSLDDVLNYYVLNPDERETLKVLLFSSNPTHQTYALRRVKEALMEIFVEEMFIEEGKRLYAEFKGKMSGRKIFLIDQNRHTKSTSMEEIRTERTRVKRIVEQYYLSRLGRTHPIIALEEESRRSSIIPKEPHNRPSYEYVFVTPQDIRDYYTAHYESFTHSVSLYEVRFESPIIALGAFMRAHMSDVLCARMRKVFFAVLDKEGVCAQPLTEEDKEELWQLIIDPTKQESPDDPIFKSIEAQGQVFKEKGVNVEKLTSLSVLPYELCLRFVGADLYKLQHANSDQEYVYGTIKIQEEFNHIFPGLIKTRNLSDFSPDILNSEEAPKLQIFPELHGRYAFESNSQQREGDWLMYSESEILKLPVFFKFRVLWEHRGEERLSLSSASGYQVQEDGLLEPVVLSKKIEIILQKIELNHFFNGMMRDVFDHYFEFAKPTREAWVQTLFPHDTFKITYQEIERASIK